jgi:Lrp/AsnC family leucine-responsive transcriptional regulator
MIDEIDRQLLVMLQEDGQLSNAALAEKVGLTVSSVHQRVKKLEEKGIIRGYTALVDSAALGKPITAFIRLRVGVYQEGYSAAKTSLLTLCRNEPDILECHGVAGEDCYILKVRVAGTQDLERLLDRLRNNGMVSQSTTNIVLSTYKESTQVLPGEK